MPLVIYGLGGVHTCRNAYTHTFRMKMISRNQAGAKDRACLVQKAQDVLILCICKSQDFLFGGCLPILCYVGLLH